jgi:hypothetical protein
MIFDWGSEVWEFGPTRNSCLTLLIPDHQQQVWTRPSVNLVLWSRREALEELGSSFVEHLLLGVGIEVLGDIAAPQ